MMLPEKYLKLVQRKYPSEPFQLLDVLIFLKKELFCCLLFNGIFASGNFSRSSYAIIAAVYNLVWEINELA